VTCKGVYEYKNVEQLKFYAFVAYEEDNSSTEAINKFNNMKLGEDDEEPLYVSFAMSKEQRKMQLSKEFQNQRNNTNLYIKSIRGEVTDEEVRNAFSKFGEITSIFFKDCTGSAPFTTDSLKFGFINYRTKEGASEAFLNAKKDPEVLKLIHSQHKKSIDFIFYAQPKGIRLQYLRMKKKMMQPMMNNQMMFMMKNASKYMGFENFSGFGKPMDGQYPLIPEKSTYPGFQFTTPPVLDYSSPTSNPNEPNTDNAYDVSWLRINQREFQDFSEEKKRNILGELMFNSVSKQGITDPAKISKITGMLIDLEILELEEILDMLENEDSLKERISEALDVIEESEN
jgi:RNA recognition motif-containing protein